MFTKSDWKLQVLKLFPSQQGYQLVRNCMHRAKNGMRTRFALFVEDVTVLWNVYEFNIFLQCLKFSDCWKCEVFFQTTINTTHIVIIMKMGCWANLTGNGRPVCPKCKLLQSLELTLLITVSYFLSVFRSQRFKMFHILLVVLVQKDNVMPWLSNILVLNPCWTLTLTQFSSVSSLDTTWLLLVVFFLIF